MNQSRQALPRRRLQTLTEESGQAPRFDVRKHEGADHQQVNEDARLPEHPHPDSLDAGKDRYQDAWVTNFIGRLAALVRNIGDKK
jgi:hypothetical protein